ncbi:hypothetical protein M405DRAFT_836000, partial [Rhizopogon salebrosus TDB-379]
MTHATTTRLPNWPEERLRSHKSLTRLLYFYPPAPPKDFCLVRLARPSTRYHISSALTHTH